MQTRTISRFSYLFVASLLFLFEAVKINEGVWTGDFWSHAAVVKELTVNLSLPSHPILDSSVPHAFFSPYSVLVATVARVFDLGAIEALSLFAYLNLLFLLTCFFFFIKKVVRDHHQLTASISLVLVLFLWGQHPPNYSGFFHFYTLHYVLPYPSTFAMGVSLLVLCLLTKEHPGPLRLILVTLLSAVVFISHPTTAVFLFIAMAALWFVFYRKHVKALILTLSIIVLSVLLSLFWPYYKITDLYTGDISDFLADSLPLYSDVLQYTWPALLILPFAWHFRKHQTAQFFFVTAFLLFLVYAAGYFTKIYGVSRLLSNVMMMAQCGIGWMVVNNWQQKRRMFSYTVAVALVLFICTFINRYRLAGTIFRAEAGRYYQRYQFLESMSDTTLILADMEANLVIPAYGPKVIASKHPVYWINDMHARREDVIFFFSNEPDINGRESILQQYRPQYILIDHAIETNSQLSGWIRSRGKTVYHRDKLELIRLAQ